MPVDANSEPNLQVEERRSLITLPVTTREFIANGVKYYVEEDLSIERYRKFQQMEIELGFGLNFSILVDKLQKAYAKHNERQFADVAVAIHSILAGAAAIGEKKPQAIYVATMFINRADEDRAVWSRAIAERKIEDWKDINVDFFLALALARVRDFERSFIELSKTLQSVGQINLEELNEGIVQATDENSASDIS